MKSKTKVETLYNMPLEDIVNSLVSGHPWELKKVSVSRAVRLQELFPYAATKEK